MENISIYRKYRPKKFSEVLGQTFIVNALINQIKTNTVSHAYLFSGTRGTGKTTMARLLAMGLNCLSSKEKPCGECENCKSIINGSFLDIIELDAASNRGIDDVKKLKELTLYPPSNSKFKVFIIDEVHMMTKEAFNALLKTLEEPPAWLVFVLCTTEKGKLPNTILSRCVKFNFKRVPTKEIGKGLDFITKDLGVSIDVESKDLLIELGDGSVRDTLSTLEQVVSITNEIKYENLIEILGRPDYKKIVEIILSVSIDKDISKALVILSEILDEGAEERAVLEDLIKYSRYILIIKNIENPNKYIHLSDEKIDYIKEKTDTITNDSISKLIEVYSKYILDLKYYENKKIILEAAIIASIGE